MKFSRKVYNVLKRRYEVLKAAVRRSFFVIDRRTNMAKVYYTILKSQLPSKQSSKTAGQLTTEEIAKSIYRKRNWTNKKIGSNFQAECWSYLRQLEKFGFIRIDRKGKFKNSSFQIDLEKFADAVILKIAEQNYLTTTIDRIIKRINALRRNWAINVLEFITPQDCEDFLVGTKPKTPLSLTAERIMVLANEYKMVLDLKIFPSDEDECISFIEKNFEGEAKTVLLLSLFSTFFSLGPEEEKRKEELKKLGIWDEEKYKKLEEHVKNEMMEKIEKRLKKLIAHYKKLYEKAKKREWDERFEQLWFV